MEVCKKCGGQVLSDGACLQCGEPADRRGIKGKDIPSPVVCVSKAPGGKKPGRPNTHYGARLHGSKYGRYY